MPPLKFPPIDGKPVPPLEAIRLANARNVVLPDVYYGKLQGSARQAAFSIAGIARLDQLQAVKDSLDKHLAEGKTFKQWQREQAVKDLGLPKHRLDNIFRTNMQSAYRDGQWERALRVQDDFPFCMYDAVNDSRTRPTHLAKDGIIRRTDDPVWRWLKPGGYRCRCGIKLLTERQANSRSKDSTGLNKPLDPEKMAPDKGWVDADPSDRMAGIEKSVADRLSKPSKIADALASQLKSRQEIRTLDDYINEGGLIVDEIIAKVGTEPKAFRAELNRLLGERVGVGLQAKLSSYGKKTNAAKAVRLASAFFPKSWVKATNQFGKLVVRDLLLKGDDIRAFQFTIGGDYTGRLLDLKKSGFGIVGGGKNKGYIATHPSYLSTALHEYTHRMQSALPELDSFFQGLHLRRTAAEKLKPLNKIYPNSGYSTEELAKEDNYIDAYFGKEYDGSAKEMMTMALETLLSRQAFFNGSALHPLIDILEKDREMINLATGVLFKYAP